MSSICCPVGYVYVDGTGTYSDPALGTFIVSNYVGAPVSTIYNKCVRTQTTNAFGPFLDPNPCPCCPVNYTYSNFAAACYSNNAAAPAVGTIPCVECVCPEITPPTCPESGSTGLPVTFNINMDIKNCTDCSPQDVNNPPGGIQTFLPAEFLDPITSTFVLRNKNYM